MAYVLLNKNIVDADKLGSTPDHKEIFIMKRLIVAGILVSFLALAGIASATPITLNEVGVNDSAIINATFKSQMNGTYDVYAGYYQLSINDAKAVNGFCVDPAWAPTSDQKYDLRAIDPSSKYAKAAYLFSLSTSTNAAATQIAIWETVMGSDFTWNHPNTALKQTVDSLLGQLSSIPGTFDLSRYSLAASPGNGPSYGQGFQDYIVNTPVPEPSTLILLGAGLAGLVFVRRKNGK